MKFYAINKDAILSRKKTPKYWRNAAWQHLWSECPDNVSGRDPLLKTESSGNII